MAERRNLVIGTDRKITIYAIKKLTREPVDLTLFDGYGVILYYPIDGTVIAKYSANDINGWNSDDLDITDEKDGKLIINFRRSLSINGRSDKQVNAQIVAQYADPAFDDAQFRDIVDPFYVFHFIRGGVTETVDMS